MVAGVLDDRDEVEPRERLFGIALDEEPGVALGAGDRTIVALKPGPAAVTLNEWFRQDDFGHT